jgi:hypothetical protein
MDVLVGVGGIGVFVEVGESVGSGVSVGSTTGISVGGRAVGANNAVIVALGVGKTNGVGVDRYGILQESMISMLRLSMIILDFLSLDIGPPSTDRSLIMLLVQLPRHYEHRTDKDYQSTIIFLFPDKDWHIEKQQTNCTVSHSKLSG